MAALTGSTIASTYLTLIKLTSAALDSGSSAKYIEDAAATASALSLSTTRVGIGTATPVNTLHVAHNIADGDNGIMIVNEQTTITDGELLGAIGFDGADGNIPSSCLEASAFIAAYAAEDHGSTDKGAHLAFGTSLLNEDDDVVSNEHMRIIQSGRVGINNTAPSTTHAGTFLEVSRSAAEPATVLSCWSTSVSHEARLIFQKSASATINTLAATADDENLGCIEAFGVNSSSDIEMAARILFEQDAAADSDSVSGRIVFYTSDADDAGSPTKAMTIDSAQNLGIGTASPLARLHTAISAAGGNSARIINSGDTVDSHGIWLEAGHTTHGTSGTTNFIDFRGGNGATTGVIKTVDGTLSLADSSDIRLKDSVVDTSINGLTVVNAMKVRDYNWKGSSTKITAGFIANELKDVFAPAVGGEPDAMESYPAEYDDDGNETKAAGTRIAPMTVSRERLVPVLVKAIQELSAKVTVLENA